MFTIRYQRPGEAEPSVAEIYARFPGPEAIPGPLLLLSSSPELLRLSFAQIKYFVGHSALSFPVLAAVRFLAATRCSFAHCQKLNAEWLTRSGLTEKDVERLARGYAVSAFSFAENALLRLVAAVLSGERVREDAMHALRELGWRDSDVMDACMQGASIMGMTKVFTAFSRPCGTRAEGAVGATTDDGMR